MIVKRHICIHGHFYQPSRANPWLETIEIQEDAYPFHDWNEKINAECYTANTGSHILDHQKKIKKMFNNYSRMSFNFGPILLSWIKSNDTDTYRAIINADKAAQERFGGHGSAIAQIYNHIIMPLASRKDKYIQTCWAVKDFEANFGRKPEGIWLSETAADHETLEVLSEFDIKFTILSPNQALRTRKITADSSGQWTDVGSGTINTRMPYMYRLANGSSIVIFFYDNSISTKMAFGGLLEDGEFFVQTLNEAPFSPESFSTEPSWAGDSPAENNNSGNPPDLPEFASGFAASGESSSYGEDYRAAADKIKNKAGISHTMPEMVCIASDGETFGHHHKFGDMALAYALDTFESNYPQTLTVFGEYVEKYMPLYEVEIKENSSWSCAHGICRWKEDCGCSTGSGQHKGWNQEWRVPLRQAVDELARKAENIYEREIKKYISKEISDVWEPVYKYIDVVNDRSIENIIEFVKPFVRKRKNLFSNNIISHNGSLPSRIQANKSVINMLKLLEMYRQSMLTQSSDAWFFDDISRVEPVQVMRHACRTMELIKEVSSEDYEPGFKKTLAGAKSNIKSHRDGKYIYEKNAKTASYDFEKIIAYLAFETLFKASPPKEIFSYRVNSLRARKVKIDHGEIITGTAEVLSTVTLEKAMAVIAAYNFKNKDILSPKSASSFVKMSRGKKINPVNTLAKSVLKLAADKKTDSDQKKNILENMLGSYFLNNRYTLKDFLKDRQVILAEKAILEETESIKPVLASLFNNYQEILRDLNEKKLHNFFLDGIFPAIEEFIGEVLLYYKFKEKGISTKYLDEITHIITKIKTRGLISRDSFNLLATNKTAEIADLFIKDYKNTELLKILAGFIIILEKAGLGPDLWKTQNKVLGIRENALKEIAEAYKDSSQKQQWHESFNLLLDALNIAHE